MVLKVVLARSGVCRAFFVLGMVLLFRHTLAGKQFSLECIKLNLKAVSIYVAGPGPIARTVRVGSPGSPATIFQSDNFPADYPSNIYIGYMISSPENTVIEVG